MKQNYQELIDLIEKMDEKVLELKEEYSSNEKVNELDELLSSIFDKLKEGIKIIENNNKMQSDFLKELDNKIAVLDEERNGDEDEEK